MKFFKRVLPLFLCAVACASAFAGCAAGRSTQLGKPQEAARLDYSAREGEDFIAVSQSAERFAAKFASAALQGADAGTNYAVSPVSAYMALAMAGACANGQTREEIITALGVSYQTLESGFSDFYRSVVSEHKSDLGKVTGVVAPANSVWLNEGTAFKQDCLQTLADKYYSYSYSADFAHGNQSANLAVRNFVKKQTKGSVDVDFNLPTDTLFTILNTLYLKDVWNAKGDKLPFTQADYGFANSDGTTSDTRLWQGYYRAGRAYETDTYSAFYTTTNMSLKFKFILPRSGYTVNDVFTAETLAEVNAIEEYDAYDHENRLHYNTRCLFPEYAASYDGEINAILKESFGITSLFSQNADFSSLSDDALSCGRVRHVAKLEVNRRGIEGAAVTVPSAGAPGPGEYEEVYRDFVVNRAFGFIVTDWYGTTLFSGIVNKV